MEKFGNKYRIPSARLQNRDYGWNAAYFVTICTKDKEHYFGEIEKTHDIENPFTVRFSEIGHIANNFWLEIPKHFPFAILGTHVVMPNHVHGIIIIDKPDNEPVVESNGDVEGVVDVDGADVETRQCLVSFISFNLQA